MTLIRRDGSHGAACRPSSLVEQAGRIVEDMFEAMFSSTRMPHSPVSRTEQAVVTPRVKRRDTDGAYGSGPVSKSDTRDTPILPIAIPKGEDMSFGGYEIPQDGQIVSVRKNIMPGFFYRDVALRDSVEHANLEAKNLGPCKGMLIDMQTAARTANAAGRRALRPHRRSTALS